MPIAGKVAKILDEVKVVINRGSKDGVKPGMRFVAYAEVDEVTDPDTGESLGKWELVKGRLLAAHVQPRMSVCTPEPEGTVASAGAGGGERVLSWEMVAVSMMDRKRAGASGLKVDTSQMAGLPEAGPVRVGDPVRSIA